MKAPMVVLVFALVAGCAPPQDRFEAMMLSSREGRDAQTLDLAKELLVDPAVSQIVKARTEMTVALAHIRSRKGEEARTALVRAQTLGIESDTGYFKDHFAEYEGWAAALP